MKKIQDEFSHIADRKVRYQERRKAAGLCRVCGMPRSRTSKNYCPKHERAHRERVREAYGFQPWKPGGRGRPTSRRA